MVEKEIKKIAEELDKIERVDEKIDYLEKEIKKTKDEDLKEKLSLILNSIKFPQRESVESKFQEVEENPIYEERVESLENLVEKQPEIKKVDDEDNKNKKIEYWEVGDELYDVQTTQMKRIKKDEVMFRREQLGREEIRKYTPAMDIEEKERFIGGHTEKYKLELPSTSVFDIADKELKKLGGIKYERRAHKGG